VVVFHFYAGATIKIVVELVAGVAWYFRCQAFMVCEVLAKVLMAAVAEQHKLGGIVGSGSIGDCCFRTRHKIHILS